MKRAAAVVLVASCGGTRVARPPVHTTAPRDAGHVDAAPVVLVEAGPPPLDVLAAKQAELAPGAHEVLRRAVDAAKEAQVSLPVFERDTCVRVAFDAEAPTAVSLKDEHGLVLGAADGASGVLGPSGPICFHKGDVATLELTGRSEVRLVVWASP